MRAWEAPTCQGGQKGVPKPTPQAVSSWQTMRRECGLEARKGFEEMASSQQHGDVEGGH